MDGLSRMKRKAALHVTFHNVALAFSDLYQFRQSPNPGLLHGPQSRMVVVVITTLPVP
jgi:hypothetical protein